MKPALLASLLVSATAFAADSTPHLPPDAAADYKLAWHDEFDGNQLNPAEWTIRTGDRFASRNLAANVSVSGGLLHLAVKMEKAGALDHTSGGVISKREFKYGYYEARFRVPPHAGWHTSFWMMKNTPGETGARQEIDVCEQDSKDLHVYKLNLHLWRPAHKVLGSQPVKTPDLSQDFHIWGCEFTPTEIRFYFDGKLAGKKDAAAFPHDLQSIWLTTVGWANLPWAPKEKIDDTGLPASADFDYVRLFEKPALK